MEQGSSPQTGLAGGEVQKYHRTAGRLATSREVNLLRNYMNYKYGKPVMGKPVAHGVAMWSKEQLNQSLKAA